MRRQVGIFMLIMGLVITMGSTPWPLQNFRGPALQPTQTSCTTVGIGMLADVNDDGAVNADDIQLAATRWRDPNQYDTLYDVVPDQIINILDIARIAAAWGSTCSLRFVNENGASLADTTVRLLCYESANAGSPLADLQVGTNAFGRPVQGLPANCNAVAALHLRHEQPSGKPGHGPAYQVYATSWPPGTRQLWSVDGTVPISDDQTLVLFNVVASLEWEPAAGSSFVSHLEQGLRNASAYLYDLTDGQMALGSVKVDAGGWAWEAADLRFRAANDYRPSAQVGGIVPNPLPYTAPLTDLRIVYVPGEIYLGRFWDGQKASDPTKGRWSQKAAYRTLVHEWAHYALFLYDEYQATDMVNDEKVKTYCTCTDLNEVGTRALACGRVSPDLAASAMAYHYTASELWLDDEPPACVNTDQWLVHKEPDWDTLSNWELIQGLVDDWVRKPSVLNAGPTSLGLAGDLFTFTAETSALAPAATAAITVTLKTNPGSMGDIDPDTLYPQVYVLEEPATSPDRIIYQGTTPGRWLAQNHLGDITLLGVREGSLARVYVDYYPTAEMPGGRFVYPLPGGADDPLADNQTLLLEEDPWRASLDVDYGMTGSLLTTMTVTLSSPILLTMAPTVRLCVPDADIGCDEPAWFKTMHSSNGRTWTATFISPRGNELPHYGVLQVQAPGAGELLRWFQVAGGVGPAHMDAEAPLRDGLVMVDATDPVLGEHNQVVVMPAAHYEQLTKPLPPDIRGLVGVPLDVDILLSGLSATTTTNDDLSNRAAESASETLADQSLPVPVVLTLFYNQDVLDRLGIGSDQLQILHFSRSDGEWHLIQRDVSDQRNTLNWLATSIAEDGIYAVGWTASP